VASYTKTYSGDLSSFIAGKLWDKVKEWDDNRVIDESDADPIVKEAAKELKRNDDPNSIEVKDTSLREKVANIFGVGIDSKIVRTEDKVDKVAGKVSVVAGGIADTQKLIAVQNQLLEDKFDKILELYGVQNTLRKKEIEDAKAEQEELSLEENKQSSRGRQFARMMGLPTTFGTLLSQILWGATRKGLSRLLRPLKRTLMRRIPLLRNAKVKSTYRLLRKLSTKGGVRSIVGSASLGIAKNLYNILFGRGLQRGGGLFMKNQIVRKALANTVLGRQIRYSKLGRGVSGIYRPAKAKALKRIQRLKIMGVFASDIPDDIIAQDPNFFKNSKKIRDATLKGNKFKTAGSTLEGFISPNSPLKHLAPRALKTEAVQQTGKSVLKKTVPKAAAKGGFKMLLKNTIGKVPFGVGTVMGAIFATERLLRGDWLGAGAELTSGVLSAVPVKGTAASIAIDAMLLARDIEMETVKNRAKAEAYQELKPKVYSGANYDVGTKGAKSGNIHGRELIQKQSSAIATVVNPIRAATSLIAGSLLGVGNALGMKAHATSSIHDSGVDIPDEITYANKIDGGSTKLSPVSTTSFSERLKLPGVQAKIAEESAPLPEPDDSSDKNSEPKKPGKTWWKPWTWLNKGTGGDPVTATENILGGSKSVIDFWSMQGIDKSGESGVDFSFRDYKNNYNLFPGVVVEVNRKYGDRYGNVVIVRSKDPSNGKFFDSLYSHFPDGGIAVREKQPVAEGQLLGKVGFVSVDVPGVPQMQPNNAGNMSGWHTSVDFFEPDSAQPYRNWVTIAKLVQGANGSTPHGLLNRLKPAEPEEKRVQETPTTETGDSLGPPPPLPPVPDNISSNINPIPDTKPAVVQSGSSSMNDMKKSSKGKTSIVYITQTLREASSPDFGSSGADYGETGEDVHIKRLAG